MWILVQHHQHHVEDPNNQTASSSPRLHTRGRRNSLPNHMGHKSPQRNMDRMHRNPNREGSTWNRKDDQNHLLRSNFHKQTGSKIPMDSHPHLQHSCQSNKQGTVSNLRRKIRHPRIKRRKINTHKNFQNKNETPHQLKMYQNKTFTNKTQIQEVTQKWSSQDLKNYRISKPSWKG